MPLQSQFSTTFFTKRIHHLLRVLFSTTDTAPVAQYSGEVGSLTGADTNSIMSVSSGRLVINGTPALGDGLASATAFSLTQGLSLLFVTPTGTTVSTRIRCGWSTAGLNGGSDYIVGGTGDFRDSQGTFDTSAVMANYMIHLFVVVDGYVCLFVRQMTQSAKSTWTLRWIYEKSISGSYYATFALCSVAGASAQNWKLDNILVYQSQHSLFRVAGSLKVVDAASPSLGSTYTAAPTDSVIWITVTASNPLADSFDLRYRIVDANNYAAIRFDSSGTLTAVSVISGSVLTTHVSVASVLSAAGVVTIAVVVSSAANTSAIYTKVGGITANVAWTKRGTAYSVNSALANGTGVQVNATSYTPSDLKVFTGRSTTIDMACTEAINYAVCDGDSLTFGQGSTTSTYPMQMQQLQADVGALWDTRNLAVGGQKVSTILSNMSSYISTYYLATRPRNVYVLWAGTNDLAIAPVASAEDTQTNYQAACALARTAGWKVCAVTIIARDSVGMDSGFEAKRQAFNTWLRANWSTFADYLADPAANSVFDEIADASNTTYYNADKVHLTIAGNGVVASIVQTALG